MSKLVIKLNGEIEQSNFDDWQTELSTKLKAVKTELVSDNDFAEASSNVKAFKKAEKSLKEAKASALKQATDINQLFEAIDSAASETRKVRLALEKQIKSRKASIKQDAIAAAREKVRAVFKSQSDDFQLLDEGEFTDGAIFKEAIKGTRGASGMHKALDKVCQQMEDSITERAKLVKQNANTVDSLTTGHQIAFQDRSFLLAQSPAELDAIIDERIEKLSSLAGAKDASEAEDTSSTAETPSKAQEETGETEEKEQAAKSDSDDSAAAGTGDLYEITLHLRASESVVLQAMDDIKSKYREQPGFVEVTLKSADV